MNKERRKKVLKVYELLTEAGQQLAEIRNEEQEAYNNLPDSFRYGEQGAEMEEYIDMLSEVDGYLDDAISVIDQI